MIHMLRTTLVALIFAFAAPLAAQAPDPAGTWAILADGRILSLLELHRNAAAPGGWSGAWIRLDHVSIMSTHVAYDISGPVARRPILGAAVRGDSIVLTIRAHGPGGDIETFVFHLLDAGHAEFGWDVAGFPPMAMIRAAAGATVAADWGPGEHPLTTPWPTTAEMTAIFDADQADRRDWAHADRAAVARADEARRARTRALLDAGRLRGGEDFFHAAFIFQHGGTADSYLLAHTLALLAIARGRPDAVWIAAATLDRYLQTIGQRQVFGTQFTTSRDAPTTQEPYDRALISDALRQALGVPPQVEQERQRAEFERQARPPAPTPH